ncbi:MAG: hypothetical protein ACREPM_21670 [Gemmatimonadaceae bacterium]
MTIREWLDEREPAPPARLRARIDEVLGNNAQRPVADAPDQSVAAAEALLRDLLARPTAGRESALDLLAVDALVTYAFEAAATDPNTLAALADAAMTRLAALA